MTTVVVRDGDLASARRAIAEVAQRGSRRTHFSAEGDGRRHLLLRQYVALSDSIGAHVSVATCEGGDEQAARDRCLKAIVECCSTQRVSRLVLDTRHVDRDRLDRQTIARALARHRMPVDFEYTHRGSRDEPLLSLPDAIWMGVGGWGPMA